MQPGQQKITQFDEVNSTQSGDIIPIVRGGQNKKISVENFTGVLPEGWLTPAEAWTFASFGNGVGVITIPEGNINRYPNGTRVWFKQGTPTATNRYGIVIASTTTTLTVAMIGGTTLQNLAIQQPAVSSEVAPRTSENIEWRVPSVASLVNTFSSKNFTIYTSVLQPGVYRIDAGVTFTHSAGNGNFGEIGCSVTVDGTLKQTYTSVSSASYYTSAHVRNTKEVTVVSPTAIPIIISSGSGASLHVSSHYAVVIDRIA